MKSCPCRLHVILARHKHVAVVLRRGPSRWVQLIKWDTDTDSFEDGSWFHGRIYEDRGDLSPDGSLFVYFASKPHKAAFEEGYQAAWTAVSKPPHLYALAMWPQDGTYGGGGRFETNTNLVLAPGGISSSLAFHPNHPPSGITVRLDSSCRSRSQEESPVLADMTGVTWTGCDHDGQLIYCRDGKLLRRARERDVVLADFNDRKPDPRPPPDSARQWKSAT